MSKILVCQITRFIRYDEALSIANNTNHFTPYLVPRANRNGKKGSKTFYALVRLPRKGEKIPEGHKLLIEREELERVKAGGDSK